MSASTTRGTSGLSRRSFVQGAAALSVMGALAITGTAVGEEKPAEEPADEAQPADEPEEDGPYAVVDRLDREITFDKVPQRVAMTIMPLPTHRDLGQHVRHHRLGGPGHAARWAA